MRPTSHGISRDWYDILNHSIGLDRMDGMFSITCDRPFFVHTNIIYQRIRKNKNSSHLSSSLFGPFLQSKGPKMMPKSHKYCPGGAKDRQSDPNAVQKGTRRYPKGPQRDPIDTQMFPNRHPNVTNMLPERAKGEPKEFPGLNVTKPHKTPRLCSTISRISRL